MATLKQEIQKAIRDMLIEYTDCPADNIFCGYSNKVELPQSNDFIVFTILNPMRTGTPLIVNESTEDEGKITSYQDFRIEVQIDFYGNFAFDRANDIINISRTDFLCSFFKPYNIQPIACDDARNLTGVSGEDEYVERWMVSLEIDYRDAVSVSQEVFNTAELNIFETEL